MKKLLFIAVATTLTLVASAQKTAVVSIDEIFALSPAVAKADSAFNEYKNSLEEAYAELENKLNEKAQKFIDDSLKLSAVEKETKRNAIQKELNELNIKKRDLSEALEVKKESLLKPIRESILKTIRDVAKEKGFALVAYREQMIIFPPAHDITPLVKARLKIK